MRMVSLVAVVSLASCGQPKTAAEENRPADACDSAAACKAIYLDARQRSEDCVRKIPYGGGSCDALLVERRTASARQEQFEKAAEKASSTVRREEHEHQLAEFIKMNADLEKPSATCADVAALEATAGTTIAPGIADSYRKAVVRRRADLTSRIVAAIEHRTKLTVRVADLASPRDALADVAPTGGLLVELRCLDAKVADEESLHVEAWSKKLEADVGAEEKCRDTPACMGERLAVPLCDALERRRGWVADIAKERRNPAGIVNMTYLHDLGQNIQDEDARVVELRPQYAAAAHKPFSEAVCPKATH